METPSPAQIADLAQQIPRDVCYVLMHRLRGAMPTIGDTPDDLARGDRDAIARVACLLPANADEAALAVEYVVASTHAMECIRLARQLEDDMPKAMRCTAQAASMMRQARATRGLLMRVQAERRKREAGSASLDADAAGLMTEAPPPAPAADLAAEADRYALAHRKKAALIRKLGRLPDNLNCGVTSPALVRAIVTGNSPVLRALDQGARQSERLAA